ncbi:N-methylnicotinate transmembrane transporter [Aureococcus anophagefferens]|nr:N-methylnicotinate transmembrane transporter [Aureococcus anophagefferens]
MAQTNPIHASPLEDGKDALASEQEVDDVIEAIGTGVWQYALIVLLGALFLADSVEVSLLSFLYECVGAAFDLTTFEAASVVSVVFGGEVVGAVAARCRTRPGARASLVSGLGVAVFGLASAYSPDYGTFISFRGAVGIFLGTFAVPFDLLAEMLPAKTRGQALIWLEVGWALGAMYACAAAWVALPISSWRSLTVACAAPPAFVFLGLLYCLDESPRFLIDQGRRAEAAAIFRRVAAKNGSSNDPAVVAAIAKVADGESAPPDAATESSLTIAKQKLAELFDAKLGPVTAPVWVIWFCFGLNYYGITLLVTRIYATGDDDDFKCTFKYGLIFATFSAELLGALALVPTIDLFGRVPCQVATYAGTCAALLPLGLGATDGPFDFVCLFVALAAATASCSATWVHVAELYPTHVRSTAHTAAYVVSRLGAFLVLRRRLGPVHRRRDLGAHRHRGPRRGRVRHARETANERLV